MKKFVIALAIVSLSASQAFGSRNHGCCPQPVAPSCAPACETVPSCEAPVIPVCVKEVQVPYTAYRTETVTVPALKHEIPQAPILRAVPQPDKVVRHKQAPIIRPDLICVTKMPCKYVCEPQAPIIRYSCPIGTRAESCGAPC